MKVRDKEIKKDVDVSRKDCQKYQCYWARPDPGIFTQGQGYRQSSVNRGYICGTREIRGCPEIPKLKDA
jgi:hypothetical protein